MAAGNKQKFLLFLSLVPAPVKPAACVVTLKVHAERESQKAWNSCYFCVSVPFDVFFFFFYKNSLVFVLQESPAFLGG